jgi:hypothetical protein
MEEFDETATTIPRQEKVVDSVMMDRVEDKSPGFPESVAVEEDVRCSPWDIAVGASDVIPSGGPKGGGVVGMESVMCSELESGALK